MLSVFFFQAKNLYVSSSEEIRDKEVSVDTESSSTETSDSDMIHEIKDEWKKARLVEGVAVKGTFLLAGGRERILIVNRIEGRVQEGSELRCNQRSFPLYTCCLGFKANAIS